MNLILLVVVAVVFRWVGSARPAAKAPPPVAKVAGTLTLDWAPDDRLYSRLTVDSRTIRIPPQGDFEVPLSPGAHELFLERRGYEKIASRIELAANQRFVFTPQWTAVASVAAAIVSDGPGVGELAAETSSGPENEAAPPAETAPPAAEAAAPAIADGRIPRGFDGWTQSLSYAKQRAAAENKDVLLLFGSSDGSPKTLQLARSLVNAGFVGGVLADKFIAVIIDFPQTESGEKNLLDRNQNFLAASEYGIVQFRVLNVAALPTVVAADAQGRAFAVRAEWPSGLDEMKAALDKLAAGKQERDGLLEKASQAQPDRQLQEAAAATKWLVEQHLRWSYRDQIHDWYELAAKLDAENQAGSLEVFLEAELFNRLAKVDPNDNVAAAQTLGMLTDFLASNRFQDADRGFRLHSFVSQVLYSANDQEQGIAHLKRAVSYEPNDGELRKVAAAFRRRLENTNILSAGTGFVVGKDGYLLTNRHVVEGPGRLMVRIPDVSEPIEAEVVATDDTQDMALVKAAFPAAMRIRPLAISPADVRLSAGVSAYGFPDAASLGENLKVTTGAVSSLPNKNTNDMIVLDVKINPGNSGGPLCDKRGQVVGMVSAKTRSGEIHDSYGLAIKAKSLRDFLKIHLPKAAQPAAAQKKVEKDWTDVTEDVQGSVFMLLKMKS